MALSPSTGYSFLGSGLFFLTGLVFVLVGNAVYSLTTPYPAQGELRKGNVAAALCHLGYLGALVAIMLGAYLGPSQGFIADLKGFVGYALLGIALLNLSRWLNRQLLLNRFCSVTEITRDRNLGAGAVVGATTLATGLMIGGALNGEGGGILSVLAFYALGQIVLLGYGYYYDWITPQELFKEIEADNHAAGIALAGALIAVGLLVMNACGGSFTTWESSLLLFVVEAGLGLIILPITRWVTDHLLLPGLPLDESIMKDRNPAAALVEAVTTIALAALILTMLEGEALHRVVLRYLPALGG